MRVLRPKRCLSRDDVIALHVPLVHRILGTVVSRLAHTARNLREELRSAGYLGLIHAADRFDATRGVPFGAFARRHILGAMIDELRAQDPYGRDVRQINKHGREQAAQLRQELGREPERDEIAARMGIAAEKFERVAVLWGDGSGREQTLVQVPDSVDLERDAIRRQHLERVWAAILSLPVRLQRVIVLYYFDDKAMSVVAGELGINESRVSQLHRTAIGQLRVALGLKRPSTRTTKARECACAACQRRLAER